MKKLLALLMILSLMFTFTACDDDDDTNPVENEEPAEAWVGTWLSTGSDVAPLLVSLFQYDSVRVQFTEENTIVLESHVTDGAWTTQNGTYTVTKSSEGDVHTISLVYAAFEQGGIMQVIDGEPDELKLEVVQTVPSYGFAARTPETGFGSDENLGTDNIQIYKKL